MKLKKFEEMYESLKGMNDLDIRDVIKELEDLQWKLHKEKESGEISKDYFTGYSLCLFSLMHTLKEHNINYDPMTKIKE